MNIKQLLLIVLVALLVSSRLKAAEEPVYEGKPASYWIKRLADSFVPNEIFGRPSKEGPMQALRSIGPAAVPAMIEALKDQSEYVRIAAAYALGEFRADAKAAVPALVESIRSGRLGDAATVACKDRSGSQGCDSAAGARSDGRKCDDPYQHGLRASQVGLREHGGNRLPC